MGSGTLRLTARSEEIFIAEVLTGDSDTAIMLVSTQPSASPCNRYKVAELENA